MNEANPTASTAQEAATPAALYLGDEVAAAGYRLAGIDTLIPAAGTEAATLREALATASIVLVSAALAARLPASTLEAAKVPLRPLVVVVPDVLGDAAMPDIASRLRAQLGLVA